jgi:hypothetical protein
MRRRDQDRASSILGFLSLARDQVGDLFTNTFYQFEYLFFISITAIFISILIQILQRFQGPKKIASIVGLVLLGNLVLSWPFLSIYAAVNILWLLRVHGKRRLDYVDFIFSKKTTDLFKTWEKIVFTLAWIMIELFKKYVSFNKNQTIAKMGEKGYSFVPDEQEEQYLTSAQLLEEELGSVEHEVYFNRHWA